MSSECDALRAELNRISQQIAGLDQRFIPIAEKQPIYNAIDAADSKADRAFIAAGVANVAAIAAATAAATATAAAASAAATATIALGLGTAAKAAIAIIFGLFSGYVRKEEMAAIKNRISVLESGLNILTNLAQTLAGRIDRNKQDISRLQLAIDFLRGLFGTLRDRVAKNENAIAYLENKVEGLEGLISGILRQLEDLKSKVAKNCSDIADLFRRVNIMNALLTALNALVTGALATLAGLVASVARVAAAIAALVAKIGAIIAAIENALSIAQQAINLARQALNEISAIRKLIEYLLSLFRKNQQPQIGPRGPAGRDGQNGRNGQNGEDAPVNREDSALLRQIYQLLQVDVKIDREQLELIGKNYQLLQGEGDGILDISPCVPLELQPGEEAPPTEITYAGAGLAGIYGAIGAITQSLNLIHTDTKCPPEIDSPPLALPMFWEVKRGEISQLVVVWEKTKDTSNSTWSMSIPHPKKTINSDYPFAFPIYKKGGNMASVKLTDNSQIIVNAFSEGDAQIIIDYLTTLIDPAFIPSDGFRMIYSKNVSAYAEVEVKASYVKKFLGHRKTAPLWGKHLVSA